MTEPRRPHGRADTRRVGAASGAAGAGVDAGRRDLRPLFDPRSIAVVGASADASKWGGDIAARLLRNEVSRPFFFVNRRGGQICGRPAYRSLSELPETPEMVMLSMPATAFEATLDEALGMGVKALVAIFAGLGETGPEGRERERAAAERIRAAGALMIGPNCMGAADTTVGFQGVAYLDIPAGHIGFISQSGAMGEELTMRAAAAGVGFSRYVSLGNQADVTIADVLRSFRAHEDTHVVAVYAEELKGGRELARAAAEVVADGTPVVLLAPGRSAAGARAAQSHTGALVSDAAALDAVCGAAGIVRVDDPAQLFETTLGFLHVTDLGARAARVAPGRAATELPDASEAVAAGGGVRLSGGRVRLPAGRRIAIVTEGGGHGGIAADAAAAAGLLVPPLCDATLQSVRWAHPPSTGVNPVDFAIGTTDPDAYARVLPAIIAAGEVDAVLVVGQLGYWGARFPEFEQNVSAEVAGARSMAQAARAAGLPLVVATVYPEAPPALALREEGVPVYREIAAAVGVLARLAATSLSELGGIADLPSVVSAGPGAGSAVDYWAARQLIGGAGVDLLPARLVRVDVPGDAAEVMRVAGKPEREELPHVRRHTVAIDRLRHVSLVEDLIDEATAAAAELGYPVAVKALGVLHKSDVGGVVLDLSDRAAVGAAVTRMAARLGVTAVSVERMAPLSDGVELIIGCRRDPSFGPLLLVGLGGVYAELLHDVRIALAPVGEARVEELLRELRGASLLTGARGRPALDIAAAARAAAALSRLAAARPDVLEVEVNPLLVLPDGAVGLDARVILAAAATPPAAVPTPPAAVPRQSGDTPTATPSPAPRSPGPGARDGA